MSLHHPLHSCKHSFGSTGLLGRSKAMFAAWGGGTGVEALLFVLVCVAVGEENVLFLDVPHPSANIALGSTKLPGPSKSMFTVEASLFYLCLYLSVRGSFISLDVLPHTPDCKYIFGELRKLCL